MLHFRLEIGRWWLQIGHTEPEPPQPERQPSERQPLITDYPAPQVIYHPDHVGFYRLPDESD